MFCENCGKNISDTAVFCPHCGESTGAGPAPTSPLVATVASPIASAVDTSDSDEIAILEQSLAKIPDDESYRKLLAVALRDDAMKDWWEDPKDRMLLCVSREGLTHAQRQLKRASDLQFNDPDLRKKIEESLRFAASLEDRKFAASWLMVVVLGFFWIIPGVVWWYVNRRPRYLINRDCMAHSKTGKHIGAWQKMGGLQGKVYEFFENINEEWGWIMGWIFMLTIGVLLSPIFMILAFKENYLDIKKAST
jgi:hypothetical protein